MRSRLTRVLFGLLLVSLVVAGLLQAEPVKTIDPEQLATLIKHLGHNEFPERERANEELIELGEAALDPLRAAARGSADPEVRLRATRIIRAILWKARTSKSTGLELVPLTPREYRMGSPKNESGRRLDEPEHAVLLTRPYLIGVTEVTQEQYKKVMDRSPSWFAKSGGGKARVENLDTSAFPVESVSWYDAIAFCNALSKRDGFEPYYTMTDEKRDGDSISHATVRIAGGHGYRLPTEAEWEYACRAGWYRSYNYGGLNTGAQANLKPSASAGGYGGAHSWKALGRTTKVGSYPASSWNLFDVHGNVGEWCWDWYDSNYYANSPRKDPLGPDKGTVRVVRGGSWMVAEESCRSASRLSVAPGERKDYIGFRIARTP